MILHAGIEKLTLDALRDGRELLERERAEFRGLHDANPRGRKRVATGSL
jgi:hypothetical protein